MGVSGKSLKMTDEWKANRKLKCKTWFALYVEGIRTAGGPDRRMKMKT